MTTAPQWESVDSDVADLLHLVADETHPSVSYEWNVWIAAARQVASENDGIVDPNALRELVRGNVAPKRCGAFVHRALTSGLMVPTGEWVVSTDRQGKNGGKPCRVFAWVGGES
jgi:hypothetical protein